MMTRYLTSASLGVTMTLGLLYLMHILIDTGKAVGTDPVKGPDLAWILPPTEDLPPQLDERIEPPPPPMIPPTNRAPESTESSGTGTGVSISLKQPESARPKFGPPAFTDGPLVNIVRVQPAYPMRALTQNIEGYVTVGFDVSPEGSVINVFVLDSSHTLFEKSAIEAAYRFRFKSRVVDGVPVGTTGLRNRFRFKIDK
ncbi:MAG: energy transducer TonB [Gammaproteobacteria bacterium]|nr:energy transducer TonB [Gammaproteobacteria bacterium]